LNQANENQFPIPVENINPRPADPPRPVTSHVRRRSWIEPRVRIWLSGALIVLVITILLVGQRIRASWGDRQLINHGTKVEAEIIEARGDKVKNKLHTPDENVPFKMDFQLPNGHHHSIYSQLKAQKKDLAVGMTIPLFINPANLNEWTDRTEVSWVEDTLAAFILLPAVFGLVLIGLLRRLQVLKTWRNGEAMEAVVVDTRQTAAAPLSRVVKFVARDAGNKQICSVVIPTRIAVLEPDDTFWIIAPSKRPQRALVARLYE
jgi:hypothetical protein